MDPSVSLRIEHGVYTFTVGPADDAGVATIIKVQVPLVAPHDHTMKQLEIVQQKDSLVVEVDRSCLFACDKWMVMGQGLGLHVGSPQLEGHECPHCHNTGLAGTLTT